MAAGDTLFFATVSNVETAALHAGSPTFGKRNSIPIVKFADGINGEVHFGFNMPNNYDGGKAVVTLGWMPATVTTGDSIWNFYLSRIADDTDDLDAPSYKSLQITATAPSGTGKVAYSTANLSLSILDGVVGGEYMRVRLQRLGAEGDVTLSDEAQFVFVELRER